MFPKKLQHKLDNRKEENTLRKLGEQSGLIDFSSNDYLGFSKDETIFNNAHSLLLEHDIKQNGATSSRLLSGNHNLYSLVEKQLCEFHNSESALVFNSGYNANLGFFSSVPQRNDIILYDEFIHASIRDGIKLSNAKAYKFKHNDLTHLDEMLKQVQYDESDVYIVTESVFSMDGDSPDLMTMSQISKKHKAKLIVDEAHAVGVFGHRGCGLAQKLGLENNIFARIITFGKALGCHGAAILGSKQLTDFLINFSRPFIYTTALSPHALATVHSSYNELINSNNSEDFQLKKLHNNIKHFKSEINSNQLLNFSSGEMSEGQKGFIKSNSAIQCCIVKGNETVKLIANKLQQNGFDVKPILSPTVAKDEERLRFCLHSFNSEKEITKVLQLLATFVKHE